MSLKLIASDGPLAGCVQHVRSGWHTQIGETFDYPRGVVGIVVAQSFPDPGLIRAKLIEGIERVNPETVWVMRDAERKSHAATVAWEVLREHEIEPLLSPLVPAWKGEGYDLRAKWRDAEMRTTCERVIVFHDKGSGITGEWIEYRPGGKSVCVAKVFVVERGKKRVTQRKGRKPAGV